MRYLVEALTAASPFAGERAGLSKARLVGVTDAPSKSEAVKQLVEGVSVLDLLHGIRFRVTPLHVGDSAEIWARYESHAAEGERTANYGDVLVWMADDQEKKVINCPRCGLPLREESRSDGMWVSCLNCGYSHLVSRFETQLDPSLPDKIEPHAFVLSSDGNCAQCGYPPNAGVHHLQG